MPPPTLLDAVCEPAVHACIAAHLGAADTPALWCVSSVTRCMAQGVAASPAAFFADADATAAVAEVLGAGTATVCCSECDAGEHLAWDPVAALPPAPTHDLVVRLDAATTDAAAFEAACDAACRPAVLQGATTQWRANTEWTPRHMAAAYGDEVFELHNAAAAGTKPATGPVFMELLHFLRYCAAVSAHHAARRRLCGCACHATSEPLYLFDPTFLLPCPSFAAHYAPPPVFAHDLLAAASPRPPFQWLLVGPAGSGSAPHIDPLATSAWNALVSGAKLWAMLPPGTPVAVVAGGDAAPPAATCTTCSDVRRRAAEVVPGRCPEPHFPRCRACSSVATAVVPWFRRVLPALCARPHTRVAWFVQEAGDVVFVPRGWWHAVLNLTETVAVTHNFASPANLPAVLRQTCVDEPFTFGSLQDAGIAPPP